MKCIVFGATFNRAEEQLLRIRELYAMCRIPIIKEIKKINLHQIAYENGDLWTARAATDSARGHRANVAYIDNAIEDPDMIHMVFHCLTSMPWTAYHYFG